MKGIFTKTFSALRISIALCMLAMASQSFAASDKFYNYYVDVAAYPSGAGLVYADKPSNTPDPDGVNFFDFTTPAEEITVKYYAQSDAIGITTYAQPADGWLLAGFSAQKMNEDGEYVFNDSIYTTENPGYLKVSPSVSWDQESQAATPDSYPLVADGLFYALFSHVVPCYVKGQENLGTMKISKVVNEIGDNITLTAVPNNAKTTKFAYWTNMNTGEKIKDNPLDMTVKEAVYMQAHFDCDSAFTINFPEDGGYAIVYSDSAFEIPTNVCYKQFNYSEASDWSLGDSMQYDSDSKKCFWVPSEIRYSAYANQPYVMYGEGEATFVKTGDGEQAQVNGTFRYSGDKDVMIDTLAAGYNYYVINTDKEQFELMPAGTIVKPNTAFWALDNARYTALGLTAAPDVIYWNDPSGSTGIEGVNADKVAAKAKKGIYNINGQKVSRMTAKGLYIKDGEKVMYLGK